MKRRESILAALFLDLPFLVDSFWRKFEYDANRNHVYRVHGGAASIAPRPVYRSAHFLWFLLLIVFVSYGPTHAPLCQAGGTLLPRMMYAVLALVAVSVGLLFVLRFGKILIERSRERLAQHSATALRKRTLWATLIVFITLGAMVFAGIAYQMATIALQPELCVSSGWHWRSIGLFILVTFTVGATWWLGKRCDNLSFWLRKQSLLIIAVAAVVWFVLAAPGAREADGLPYRHVYALVVAALFATALLSNVLARRLLRSAVERLKPDFLHALNRSELFVQRGEPDLSVHRVWHALVNGAVYQPMLLFLFPSLVAIVVPDRYLYGACAAALVFSCLLLAWGSISTRWQQMVLYVRRWFLTGTPFIVSLLVIALAGARLAGNQYVATVLAAAPFGAIFMWIVMIYGLLWLFEHAVNQALGVQLLSMVAQDGMTKHGYTGYAAEHLQDAKVSPRGRYLAMHGAGRFAVIGHYKKVQQDVAVFHTYGYSELFSVLASDAKMIAESDESSGIAARLAEGAREIERRNRLYFNLVNALLLMLVVGLAMYARYHDRHYSTEAVVTARDTGADGRSFDLIDALTQRARTGRPAIVIAASGGGTRAALYTASALEGLAQLGLTDDIVLASGVSGGGVALANFAVYRERLPQGNAYDAAPWARFKNKVSEPFIQDVIEGAMEWRLVGATPLSALLVESFERRINRSAPLHFSDIQALGLILNTSITGHPAQDSLLLANAIQPGASGTCAPYSYLSGARLAFTNIRSQSTFPRFRDSRLPDVDFPFMLLSDPDTSVVAAAALNANFPPVFPNARVDVLDSRMKACDGLRSYYVTDGGATENLGLISALYALQSALADWPDGVALPAIHIIAIEASATDFDYRQDRGIATATGGAKERLAGGLTETLLRNLEHRVDELRAQNTDGRELDLHYLAMPLALRSRGGVGTHWMLANDILVTNPHRAAPVGFIARTLAIGPDAADRVRITREELFDLLSTMHSPEKTLCSARQSLADDAALVARWICGSELTGADLHVAEWRRLVASFADSQT